MSLADVEHNIRSALETADASVRQVLDQHMPGLAALAEKVDSDPLIGAAIEVAADALLPPEVKPVLADILRRLAATYRQQPAEPQAA